MANYPQYNYQPQQMGYQQQIQPHIQPMYQQYQMPVQPMQQPQETQFFCRPVASVEEARGIPVDFSGKPMLLPHLSAGRIYVKVLDTSNGSAIFREFRMVEPEPETPAQPAVTFAPMSMVDELKQTIAALQDEVRQLKTSGGKRKAQQEVTADEV